jgi:membrane protein implicated in regulation of membrane protease activity
VSTLLAIAALIYLDGVWRWVVFIGLLMVDVVEVSIWLRLRNKRSITGHEALVGRKGTATSDLDPKGHVRVRGELWTAVAPEPISAGTPIVVTGLDGIKLLVASRADASAAVNLSE